MSLWGIIARKSLLRGDLTALVMYAILVGLLSLATPIAVQALVSTVAFGTLLQPVVALAGLLLGGLAFAAALQGLQIRLLERLQERALVRLGMSMAERFPRLTPASYEQLSGDAAANRFYDVLSIQKAGTALLLDGLALLLQTVIAMVVLALYHPWLLAFDVLLLVCVAIIFWGLGRGAYKTAVKESKQKHAIALWLRELAQPHELWRREEGAGYGAARADALAQQYLSARRAHFRVLFRQIVGALALQVLASALLLGIGGWLVIKGQLTLGQLVAAELIVSAVLVGLAKLGKHLEKLYDLLAAADKLRGVEELPVEDIQGELLPPQGGPASLTMSGVRFSFAGGPVVLEGARFSARPGAFVGICGESGAGKTTLASLLSGVYTAESGLIELNGIDQHAVSPRSWRRAVARLSGPELFSGTIIENLSVGDSSLTANDRYRVLDALGLQEELRRLPKGLETLLRPDGAPLSRGQAIRLTIARLLLHQPRVLILDGVLDELSPAARRLVLLHLRRPNAPWTVVCMTNQEDVLSLCDEVYSLQGGALHLLSSGKRASTSRVTPR